MKEEIKSVLATFGLIVLCAMVAASVLTACSVYFGTPQERDPTLYTVSAHVEDGLIVHGIPMAYFDEADVYEFKDKNWERIEDGERVDIGLWFFVIDAGDTKLIESREVIDDDVAFWIAKPAQRALSPEE